MHIPEVAFKIASRFKQQGKQCFLVGGALRDLKMGRPVKDLDLATDALPDEVTAMFHKVIPTGIKHGTVTVLFSGQAVEITTFRIDGDYSDSRRPDSVRFSADIADDLKRRDFTINGMAYDLIHHRLLDLFDGLGDIGRRLVRAIGNPEERFGEDALRMLRGCRFACQLGFDIDGPTLAAMTRLSGTCSAVSAERIRDEFVKMIQSPLPSRGMELMRTTGLLEHVVPELLEGVGLTQPDLHAFDVYHHSLYACDAAEPDNLPVRLAALFHDIGKPAMRTEDEDHGLHFYRHEAAGADMTRAILTRLKFPNSVIDRVVHLVRQHMWKYDESWTDAAVRRFIHRVGKDHLKDLLSLKLADQCSMAGRRVDPRTLMEFRTRADQVLSGDAALSLKDLAVSGSDLMRDLGLAPGKTVGVLLSRLLECVLDDPAQNTRERLLVIAARWRAESEIRKEP